MSPEQFSFFLNRPDIHVRSEVLQALCEKYKEDVAYLRKYELSVERLHKNETQLVADKQVALKELEIERESTKRLREELNAVKSEVQRLKNQLDNEYVKRKKLRSSVNELNRVLPQDVLEDTKTKQVVDEIINNLKA